MPTNFDCPNCKAEFIFKDNYLEEYGGKAVPCPVCLKPMRIPDLNQKKEPTATKSKKSK